MLFNRLSSTLLLTFGLALSSGATAGVAGGAFAASAIGSRAVEVRAGAMRRVASQGEMSQVAPGQVEATAVGTWKGEWTMDTTGGSGSVTVLITGAQGGELSGTATTAGGPCPREFALTGWYRSSLVELTLEAPASGSGCPATRISISMRVGRKGNETIAVGHWAVMIHDRSAGKDFGFLELTRQ